MPWKLSLVLFSLGFILACGSNDGPSGGDTVHLVDASPAIDWVLDTRPRGAPDDTSSEIPGELPDVPPSLPETGDQEENSTPPDEEVTPPRDPFAAGPKMYLDSGDDPDVAVDFDGNLHLVYERDGSTFYRKALYPYDAGEENLVGKGGDPQVAVDSSGNPHVVFGALQYAHWTGAGFAPPANLFNGWRKPRIAIGPQDTVFATVSRNVDKNIEDRVILFIIKSGIVQAGPVPVGNDNNGGLDCDGAGTLHLTWRSSSVYHNSYTETAGLGAHTQLHPSSDFSWIAVDLRDDSLHVVNTIKGGGGIHYRYRGPAEWSEPWVLAVEQVVGVDDPDNVGPTIDIDSGGYKYITFAGAERVPYYLVIGPGGEQSPVSPLDPEQGSLSGGKFENPNVGCHPDRPGGFVAWGDDSVFVRGLGLP